MVPTKSIPTKLHRAFIGIGFIAGFLVVNFIFQLGMKLPVVMYNKQVALG